MSEITLKEVMKLKKITEKRVQDLILQFENDTGTIVDSLVHDTTVLEQDDIDHGKTYLLSNRLITFNLILR